MLEWESFKKRSEKTAKDLVIPAILSPGSNLPESARETQWVDFSRFTISGEGFLRTERYVEFQDEIKAFAKRVAQVIADAPPWEDFEVGEFKHLAANHNALRAQMIR